MRRSRSRPLGRSLRSLPRVIPACLGLTLELNAVDAEDLPPAEYRALEDDVVREWRALSASSEIPSERTAAFLHDLQRLFDNSPSFTALALYASRLQAAGGNRGPATEEAVAEFTAMTAALTRDFSKEPLRPPAFQGLDIANQDVRGRRAPAGSAFKRATDVIGWSWTGAPLSSPLRDSLPGEARLAIDFDGSSIASLSPIYELAKSLRRDVTVELSQHPMGELEWAHPLYNLNTAVINADLPAYAITRRGVVPGKFTSAGFFGGACSNRQPTAAEFRFDAAIPDPVLAVFATGLRVDPERVTVRVETKTWPDLVQNHAITTRVAFTLDLDGDGVPELRGVSRYDRELHFDKYGSAPPASSEEWQLMPAAGWYAYDFDFLDANVDGRWLRLSRYHVTTCT